MSTTKHSTRNIVVRKLSTDTEDEGFEISISSDLSELNQNIYNTLKNTIASHFNLSASRFKIYEDVIGQHKYVDDWDDLMDGLEQTDGDLYLYIQLSQNNDNTSTYINNCHITDDIIDITEECKEDEKKAQDEPECDDLFKWMQSHGIHQYYDLFVDEFGIESLEDILGSEIDDLIEVCDDANLTQLERQTFLTAVTINNNDNALYSWCNNINLEAIYSSLIKNGYYSPQQLTILSKTERDDLCKKLKLKYAKKKRFSTAVSSLNNNDNIIKGDRKIITVASNESNDAQANRTILFVGETGTGKTTTINSMMNYLYDTDFYGDRYQLITEQFDDKKSTESQTSQVSVYYLVPTAIDFSLTIVDTPGFGNCDKKGIVFDQVIAKQLEHLFKTKVTEIDGICFVVKASETRLTKRQQYVFRQVIDVFGENVANNIILLFTFDDGKDPPLGLKAVDNNNPEIPHRESYFKFNNRPFEFHIDLQNKKNKEQFDENMEVFAQFFEELTKTETQSLQLAAEVLRYRDTLKNIIQTVHIKLKDGLNIYQVIINRIKEIERNKDAINENDETLITIQVPESRKVIKKKKKNFLKKLFSDDEKKMKKIAYMNDDTDNLESFWVCEQCKLNCMYRRILGWYECPGCNAARYDEMDSDYADRLKKVKYKYQLVLKDVKVPIRQLDSGYLDSTIYQPRSDRLIAKETERLKDAETDLCELIIKIKVCINKIKELALNKDLLSTSDYFDILIHEEKTRCTQGWEDRVNALTSLKKQQEVIANIEHSMEGQNIDSIFPEFELIKLFHEKEEQKENERIANMSQKSFVDVQSEKHRPKPNDYRKERWWWFWSVKVFNLKYDDILQNFRGHIIATDTVDRTHLINKNDAINCGILSKCIYRNRYKKGWEKKWNVAAPQNDTGTFRNCVRWMLLSPKDKICNNGKTYLIFKGTSELLEIIVNIAAIPHKLFSNNTSENIEVHGGMYGSLMREFERIMREIEKLKIGQKDSIIKELFITGHSLGGGLAILFAYEMIRRQLISEETMTHCKYNVVTFGAPAVLAYSQTNDDKKKKKQQSISEFMKQDKKIQILNDITHCYVNRLDPVPRLMHLLHSIPDIMPKIIRDIIKTKTTNMKALHGLFVKAANSPLQQLQQALSDLNPGELSSLYFCVGKQYICCGKHKKYYCGEEMKIRARSDIVSTFDLAHIAKDIPLTIWQEMIDDHTIANYNTRLKGITTLI